MALALSTNIAYQHWESLLDRDPRLIATAWELLKETEEASRTSSRTPGPGGPDRRVPANSKYSEVQLSG